MTEEERLLLNRMGGIWNEWTMLPDRLGSDDNDMCYHIHAMQAIIALRIARRVDPNDWRSK